jgi:transposase
MSTGEKHLHGDRPAYLSACNRLTRFRPPAQLCNKMNDKSTSIQRVIGFDSHPDSFTAAVLRGTTPANALTEKLFNKVPISRLTKWAQDNTTAQDLFVLEASGNSFQVVRTLAAIHRRALVLESCQMGKLKEAHANNDKISAVRIGKAWLAGTAKEVWIPDLKTQERRDWFHADRKAVRRTTQIRNRLLSYLSDNGVRFSPNNPLQDGAAGLEQILQAREWSPRQKQVLEGLLMEIRHAQERRQHWESLIAQEVLTDPQLLAIVRLCGVRDKVAFALGAIIGDIHRFESPKKLVKYFGLNPAFDDSGEGQWHGGIGGHGREDVRTLLIESAQAIFRSKHPLAQWGRRLLRRKGSLNLVVAAIARRLTVAVWYLLMGRWTPLEEIDDALSRKVGKIISRVGRKGLKELGKTRPQIRQETFDSLKTTKIYVLNPNKKMPLRATPRKIPFLPASPSLLKNTTPSPGFIALLSSPQRHAGTAKKPSRPAVLAGDGARVASQRSPILRSGKTN